MEFEISYILAVMLISLCVLVAVNVPIAIAVGISTFLMFFAAGIPNISEVAIAQNMIAGLDIVTLLGIPMYADIFGTIPVAEALLYKGAQLGTVLSFMMAVTTLSLPSLIMLRKAVKPKLLAVFVAVCTVGIVLVGYMFNFMAPML